jgi:drug/metabolite transporter (DMT)-like permease
VDADAVAAVLALAAAVFFALAATLWQRATLNLSGVSFRHPTSFLSLAAQRVWLVGLAVQGVGIVLQGAALDRGRLAIVQPLLVTTVIFAMPLGYFLTGQKITARQLLGAAIIVVGLAVFSIFGDPAEGVDNAPTYEWIAAFVVLGAICGALRLVANRGGLTAKAAVYGAIAGILFGVAATLMKPVVEALHTDGWGVFEDWQLYVMAAAGVVGFLIQQISLATGRLVASVATVSVANPVVSVLLGILILEERLSEPHWQIVVAIGGLAFALFGAVVIASAREGETAAAAQRGERAGAAAPSPSR